MDHVRLGTSDLAVSRVALGCMSFGDPRLGRYSWTLDGADADPIFRQAVELGITFWDTANVYGQGTSEELVGRAVRRFTRRDDVVLATKVGLPMHAGPGGSGLSRRAIVEQLEGSLQRLGTSHIDLYQIHRFDPSTPAEETMEALHDQVVAGKVRYLGASSMAAWQFAKLQHVAELNGWTRFVSMQDQYSLVQREEEREMFPLLADQGVDSIPWCPLAKGRLARPFGEQTARSTNDPMGEHLLAPGDRQIVDAVSRVADRHGRSMAEVALAWVLANPVVASPVVGATRPEHLADAAAATELELTSEDELALTLPYAPRLPTGY